MGENLNNISLYYDGYYNDNPELYRDYMIRLAMTDDLSNVIELNTVRQIATNTAIGSLIAQKFTTAIEDQTTSLQHIATENTTILKNTLNNNPLRVKAREHYNLALDNYNKGFFEEVIIDLEKAIEINKTDYFLWFLLGMTYFSGVSEFCCVIDLDKAIESYKTAAKYIKPDTEKSYNLREYAAVICFSS